MDKLKALYDSYISQGLLSSETTFEQFSTANEDTINSLYSTGISGKALSPETNIETFKSAWGEKKKSSRYSFKWGKGCYGIHYKNGNNSYIFGFFRIKHTS